MKRSLRRRISVSVAAAAALAVLVPGVLWLRYHHTYVVSRNAQVKGYIADVGAEVDGVVSAVLVDAGEPIRAGQVLVRFQDRQFEAAVRQARSQLERTTQELQVEILAIEQERHRLTGRAAETAALTAAAQAQLHVAQSLADEAKHRYDVRAALAQQGIITKEELRTAETSRNTATAEGQTAAAQVRAAAAAHQLTKVEREGLGVRAQHLQVLRSNIAADEGALAAAEEKLKAATIRAPDDGWVVRRIAQPGAAVQMGQPIMSLWIGGGVWVEAWVDEDDLGSIAVGNLVDVRLKSYRDREFSGRVESVGVSTDREVPDTSVPEPRHARLRPSPVVCVRVRLDRAEGLFPGLSAVVGIRRSPPGTALAVLGTTELPVAKRSEP